MLAIKKTFSTGFSLIELAMVLFIIGLILGGLLVPLSTSYEQQNRTEAREQLEQVRDALLGYAVINGRLPCPDCPDSTIGTCAAGTPNDGMEDFSTGPFDCRTDVGNVPHVDLQVAEFDPWGNNLTYQASPLFSRDSNTAACGTATVGVSFELCTDGDIDLYDQYSADYAVSFPAGPNVADNVIAVVVSHGSNFLEDVQTDQEVENYGRNPVDPDTGATILSSYTASDYEPNIFISADFDQGTNYTIDFDDMVIWIPATVLMNQMVSAGRLP